MRIHWRRYGRMLLAYGAALAAGCEPSSDVASPNATTPTAVSLDREDDSDVHGGHDAEATALAVKRMLDFLAEV